MLCDHSIPRVSSAPVNPESWANNSFGVGVAVSLVLGTALLVLGVAVSLVLEPSQPVKVKAAITVITIFPRLLTTTL
jgi:hypothetical protein